MTVIIDSDNFSIGVNADTLWGDMIDRLRQNDWSGAYFKANILRRMLEDGIIPNVLNLNWPDLNKMAATKVVHHVIRVYAAHKHYGKELPKC